MKFTSVSEFGKFGLRGPSSFGLNCTEGRKRNGKNAENVAWFFSFAIDLTDHHPGSSWRSLNNVPGKSSLSSSSLSIHSTLQLFVSNSTLHRHAHSHTHTNTLISSQQSFVALESQWGRLSLLCIRWFRSGSD
ncbi:hypothetical protein L6164_027507 [Bauhinia variegata]|uniref:Uncharacterized protein n=1 Tax=Bauhinia variegata TaxID=167791 RepID=A0ACB9LTK7_BAUVA|nr:hypothetical protein L6164_027507 [Bauhinia variegata]